MFIFTLFFAVAAAMVNNNQMFDLNQKALNDDHIAQINREAKTWSAGRNDWLDGKTYADVQKYLGWKGKEFEPELSSQPPMDSYPEAPSSFDSRKKWPGLIGPILNQADCGSCWAFGGVEAISDRHAIANGTTFTQFSPLQVVTCDNECDGCDGGMAGSTWEFVQENGLVTSECLPYNEAAGGPIPTCPPQKQPCLTFVNTPPCKQTCNGNHAAWNPTQLVKSVYSVG